MRENWTVSRDICKVKSIKILEVISYLGEVTTEKADSLVELDFAL